MMLQVLFQYVLMQNRKKGQLSKSLTKTKPSFLQPKQPETDRERKPKESTEVSVISRRKRPQVRQQTETDGERKRQIQYQLIPSSLPKSKLPWDVTLQRETQAKPTLASAIINVMSNTHVHVSIYSSTTVQRQTDVYGQLTWTVYSAGERKPNSMLTSKNRNKYPTLMHSGKSESSPQSGQERPAQGKMIWCHENIRQGWRSSGELSRLH